SNTRRLAEVAKCRAFRAGTMEEVREIDLDGVAHLGVTAGASTPERFVDEVVSYLKTQF
ncbi:MAG TPA: 4-hydroxy-3-methylbut-2-enyl diphosphate reductase, partial [Verrucomicrobia bacterium]|nr:4-hydroxy-3-methylbut-2-enyl diphosphate reductase [Verrucomicrobiota bacterium]